MLQNNEKKFVFIHIQKTAGSSIAKVLSKDGGTKIICPQHTFIKNCSYNKDYFKFTIVRNPWDRLVSWYNIIKLVGVRNNFYKYILNNSKNFSEFINLTDVILDGNVNKSISFNQLDYISDDNGKILVDYIGKFENLNEDIKIIGERIGYVNLTIPHLNKFKHKDYRTYYTDRDIELVQEMYKRDIDYFNYKFD